jgi:hypothetical protein
MFQRVRAHDPFFHPAIVLATDNKCKVHESNLNQRRMKKSLTIFLLVCLWMHAHTQSLAPTVVATSGEFFSNASGQLSWTMGEISTETFSDGQNFVTQGFQQTNLFVTSVNDIATPMLAANVYPNPTADFINLSFAEPSSGNILIELFDSQGQLTYSESTPVAGSGDVISINMRNMVSGIYMLKITCTDNTQPRIFKIQKVN